MPAVTPCSLQFRSLLEVSHTACLQSMITIISRWSENYIPFWQKMASSWIVTPLSCSPEPFGVPGPADSSTQANLFGTVCRSVCSSRASLCEHPGAGFQAVCSPGCLSFSFIVAGPCLGIFIEVLWQKNMTSGFVPLAQWSSAITVLTFYPQKNLQVESQTAIQWV